MKKKAPSDNDYEYVQTFPLIIFSICGLLLIAVGTYLSISHQTAIGTTMPNRIGQGGGARVAVNGPFTIGLGLVMAVPSLCVILYYRVKKYFKR